MGFELIPFSSNIIQLQAASEIVKRNELTSRFGLTLSREQAAELVETRASSLRGAGRIEFGGGVIEKLIEAFCDSPYLTAQNYAQSLHELVEAFYYFKNETLDLMTDDDLIKFMKTAFDGVCHGSLDLLTGRELERMARNLRFGLDEDEEDDDE